ncbi:MAG: DUF1206 domain-containing protein [Chitinophagaceae bacterium]
MPQSDILHKIKPIAQAGLISKGIVYCLIGVLAFMAAFEIAGTTNSDAGKHGALRIIEEQTGGKIFLALVTAGLFCYCVWRALQAFADTEHKGTGAKGISSRLRYLFSCLIYLSVAMLAVKLLMHENTGDANSYKEVVSTLMSKRFGEWIIGLLAFIIAAVGVYQIYYALSEKYRKHVTLMSLPSEATATLLRAGKIGYLARGVVWLIISWLLLQAAIHSNAAEAGDTVKAFQFIETSSYGSILLGIMGIGLVCYGAFNFIRARYESFR